MKLTGDLDDANTCRHCGEPILEPHHVEAARLAADGKRGVVTVPCAVNVRATEGVPRGVCVASAVFLDGMLVGVDADCAKDPELARRATRTFSYRCDLCGAELEPAEPSWRMAGESWEHKCPGLHPQAGHPGTAVAVYLESAGESGKAAGEQAMGGEAREPVSVTATERELAAAFTEWDRRYREEPERFWSEVRHLTKETPETYGDVAAPYLVKLLRELFPAVSGGGGAR